MTTPECPRCNKGTQRQSLGTSMTLLSWFPRYDENGNLINKDPNTYRDAYRCIECNGIFQRIRKAGEEDRVEFCIDGNETIMYRRPSNA